MADAQPVVDGIRSFLQAGHQAPLDSLPPAFRFDIAAALNHEYVLAAPLEGLLKQHRLLALARASLAERLAILREIARRDLANPVWNQDIATFEKVRAGQLRADVERLR